MLNCFQLRQQGRRWVSQAPSQLFTPSTSRYPSVSRIASAEEVLRTTFSGAKVFRLKCGVEDKCPNPLIGLTDHL